MMLLRRCRSNGQETLAVPAYIVGLVLLVATLLFGGQYEGRDPVA